jgi:phage terminase large subunit-like protein
MRTSKREKLVYAQRKALDAKRSAVSRLRKEKRKEKGKAADIVMAIKRSPAGKKAAEALKTKRGIARKREQANYQETLARAGARMGGRRKQIEGELREKLV